MPPRDPRDGRIRIIIALTVTAVWAASFIADVALGSRYDPPVEIHGIMLVVVGGIFGVEVWKQR